MRPRTTLLLLLASTAASGQSVTFQQQAAAVGDQIEQAIQVEMHLEKTHRREEAIVDQSSDQQLRNQHRVITASNVQQGRAVEATVQFLASQTTVNDKTAVDPIEGRRYICQRQGEQLLITAADGSTPPLKEFELVSRAMETFGKPNPLAELLAGKTLEIGDRLTLPPEIARRALGIDHRVGEVERFTLELKRIEPGVASFHAEIEAAGAAGPQMRLFAAGEFDLDPASCRVSKANLQGPVALSVRAGDEIIDARGKLHLAISSSYRSVR